MSKCPCINCPERQPKCHSEAICKRGYPEWAAEQKAKRVWKNKDRDAIDFTLAGQMLVKKKTGRKT